jgi:hypothetical protein
VSSFIGKVGEFDDRSFISVGNDEDMKNVCIELLLLIDVSSFIGKVGELDDRSLISVDNDEDMKNVWKELSFLKSVARLEDEDALVKKFVLNVISVDNCCFVVC